MRVRLGNVIVIAGVAIVVFAGLYPWDYGFHPELSGLDVALPRHAQYIVIAGSILSTIGLFIRGLR